MKIYYSVYWDGGGSVGDEVRRCDNGKVDRDVGGEVGSGDVEEDLIETRNYYCSWDGIF